MEILAAILLADDGSTIATAEKGVGVLERLISGGVPLICLAIAVICGAAFYWQLRKNGTQQGEHLNEVKLAKTEAERFLREMLDRDREASEAQLAAVQSIESVGHSLRELRDSAEALRRDVERLSDRMREVEDTMRRRDG